ncbi:unnamed protein product, partial [Discosporangium mesarthrocarpum]
MDSVKKEALIQLSDELNLNEVECAKLWIEAGSIERRRDLEHRLGEPPGSLVRDVALAARKLFHLDRATLLRCGAELFKA